ncbi:MAG: hypothetical protein U0354_19840 [Candidatus Sericytochromatia bacterium]
MCSNRTQFNIDDWENLLIDEINNCLVFFEQQINLNYNFFNEIPISFPIVAKYKKNEKKEIGAIVGIKEVASIYSLKKDGKFSIKTNYENLAISENYKVNETLPELVKTILKNKFKNSIDYINLSQSYSLYLNLLDVTGNINDNSHNLAFAVSTIINSTNEIKSLFYERNNNNKICLTGELNNNTVNKVGGIEHKLKAVLCYQNITKFYVPDSNFKEMIDIYNNKDGYYSDKEKTQEKKFDTNEISIFNKTFNQDYEQQNSEISIKTESTSKKKLDSKIKKLKIMKQGGKFLEVIAVEKVEDVLIDLFGEKWYELPAFKNTFDLTYKYKEEVRNSDFVKIKNIIEISTSDKGYSDIDNFVDISFENEDKNLHEPSKDYKSVLSNLKDNKKIIIRAGIGSGKSTVLRKMLNELLTNENYNYFIPVFIELQILKNLFDNKESYVTKEIIIQQSLAQRFKDIETIEIYKEYLLQQNNLIFLLDAYDELGKSEDFNDLDSYIQTTRPTSSVNLSGKIVYKLLSLTKNSIIELFGKYIEDDNKKLEFTELITSNDKLHILLNNPLILTLVIFNVISKSDYLNGLKNADRFDIIKDSVKNLINKKLNDEKLKNNISSVSLSKDPNLDIKDHFTTKLISKIAFKSFDMKETIDLKLIEDVINKEIKMNNSDDTIADKNNSDKSVENLFINYISSNTGFLEFYKIVEEKDNKTEIKTHYKFFHEMFQEYFTSKYVDYDYVTYLDSDIEYIRNDFVEWVNSRKFNVKYTFNILPFLARMIEEQEKAKSLTKT